MGAAQEMQQMRDAGFTGAEITDWAMGQRKAMSQAGFNDAEIDTYFGQPPFNDDKLRKQITDNFEAHSKKEGAKPVTDIMGALEAGFQLSTAGLLARGKAPDKVVAEDAPRMSRIAGNVATIAGDIPAMAGGFMLGSPGGPITGTAGAFALPAGLRATLMDAYDKGQFATFSDFWDRASGIFIDTSKAWLTGAATGTASVAVPAVLPAAVSPTVRTATTVASEVATMTTVGKALDGEVPSADDFLDAAILIGGAKGAKMVAGKLRQVYAETGVKPTDVAQDIAKDPTIGQDLLSSNRDVPEAYSAAAPSAAGGGAGGGAPPAAAAAAPAAPAPGSVAAAQQTILSKINVGGKAPADKMSFQDLYRRVIDDLNPINEVSKEMAGGQQAPTAENAYQLARLTRGTFGKAEQFLEYGTFDFKTYANNGPSLKAVLAPVADDLDGLRAYAASKRAVELDGRGIKSGLDVTAAQQVVGAGRATYEPVMRELVNYQNRTTKYLRDAGVISDETYKTMLAANKDYVPFFRVMDDGGPGGASVGKGMQTRDPLRGIKGSDKDIIDPLESVIKNTYVYVSLAERNTVGKAFLEAAQKTGTPDNYISKVNPDIRATTVTDKEMTDFLAQHGITNPPPDLLTVFRAARAPLAENEIAVFDQGKRSVYEVAPDVATAFKAADQETASLLVKIIAAPAKLLRAGSVLSPDFIVRNVFRDLMDAIINTKGAVFSPIDTLKGAKGLVTKDADFQNWLKGGGANATLVAMDRRYLQNNLEELTNSTGLGTRAWNVVKSPIEFLRATSELMENATRLGEFKKIAGGATDKATIQEAAFASREVTLDFARIGANVRAINMISAFANAEIQGNDRIIRQFGAAPVATTARVAGAITLPSVLLWWANHDDPRWKDIPDWQKDLFWIVMTKDHVFRVPKPFGPGIIFGSVPERILDSYFGENPEALKGLEKSILQAFSVNLVPTIASPMIDQFANRSQFTGAPLVPSYLEKLLPEYQYNEYTTETTKALGQLIGAVPSVENRALKDSADMITGTARALTTPILLEHYLQAWSGGLGMYALKLADAALRKSGAVPDPVLPASTLADIPVVKAFVVRYPAATAQSIQDFYDKFYENKKVWDTWNAKAAEGDLKAMERVQAFRPEAMVQLDSIRETLTEHSQMIRLIWKNPDFEPDEKRQLIDSYYYMMIEMAHQGNAMQDQIAKALKPGVEK